MKPFQQYSFLKALRPFSLVIAVISCGLGVVIAWNQGFQNSTIAFWILVGGILAQAGINLINDIEDLPLIPNTHAKHTVIKNMINRNTKAGILCFMLAGFISLYLISIQGWPLFLLILVSGLASLSYNIGPFNFKHRGLAMVQVFLLMGILMVQGAYLAMTGSFSYFVLLHSIPISLLVSLLLLSNELRDWESDKFKNIKTLTVRIGYQKAVQLYWGLIAISYLIAILLLLLESQGSFPNQPHLFWLLMPLPLLLPLKKYLAASVRVQLTPMTGRFFFIFGIAYMLALY